MKNRRQFLKESLLGSLVFGSILSCARKTQPNIVFIIGDDISVDDMGCYGHPHIRTPNIDQLASDGVRFTNAYLTASSCSPTRCSIITGRYPHNTGAPELHMPLPEDQQMFPNRLRQAGYYCAQAGKWHLGEYAKQAFDKVYGGTQSGPGAEAYWVNCLRERPMDRPFFMWFASTDAHRGWQPDDQAEPHKQSDVIVPPYLVDTPSTRAELAKYYDEIQRLDRFVGQVIRELERQQVLDNTIVIFLADNGRPFPRDKMWLFDSGIKTPFVVRPPKGMGNTGQTCHSLISVIDIAPTLLELADEPVPETVQGHSFLSLLKHPERKICDYVFAERNWHVWRANERLVRWKKYTYIHNFYPQLPQYNNYKAGDTAYNDLFDLKQKGRLSPAQSFLFTVPYPEEQLYDLEKDPHQLNNLAEQANYRDILTHLRQKLEEWRRQTGDTAPPVDKVTPDRHDRQTGKRLYEAYRPPTGVLPGDEMNAQSINNGGTR